MSTIRKLSEKTTRYYNLHPHRAFIVTALVASFLLNIIIHTLECHSLISGIAFIFKNTYFFIVNYLIILITLLIAVFLKRRAVFMSLFAAIWLGLGIANFVLTLLRPMPLSAIDFLLLTTALDVIPRYLSVFEIILCLVGIIAVIFGAVFLIRKAKKFEINLKYGVTSLAICFSLFIIFLTGGALSGRLDISYEDVKKAYDEHGFVYCFSSSLVDKGISEPNDYSKNELNSILNKYSCTEPEKTKTPNIIAVQLESFFDVSKYSKYTLNIDPLPNFHKICEKHGQGNISVPSNGGGTVNTEFEFLTGMNLEYFGAVEYPYSSILKKKTCESAPYILDEYGYTSHAIHNHTGVFYRRNEVYPNLGFDTFTPLEYMQYELNEIEWAKDKAILPCIIDALDCTEGKDFIFAVTVEGHGLYQNEDREDIAFKVSEREILDGGELKNAYMYEYYCNLLYETDKFIGDLYDFVMSSNEEIVVILYGDHLPSLEFDSDYYECGSDYVTQYTVFSNISDSFEYKCNGDVIPVSRLTSSVFEKLGIDGGIINRINRYSNNEDYDKDLETVQYDMLYGEGFSYCGNPPLPTEIKFGCNEIRISEISFENGSLTVYGENFTKASCIFLNGWERDTEYINENELRCSISKIDEDDEVSVRQCAVDGKELSEVTFEQY